MTGGPPIFRDAPAAVDITVDGDPFRTPWKLVLRRPGLPPCPAECVLIMDATADGDPHLRVMWKGRELAPDVRTMFEEAITAHLSEVLGSDLTPMPEC